MALEGDPPPESTKEFNKGNAIGDFGMDKQFLTAPVKSAVDKFQLLPEFLKIRGLVKQHLDSFNYFVKTDMKKIVRANDTIRSHRFPHIYLRFLNVRIDKPSIMIDGSCEDITPQKCRLSDQTYAAPIQVDVEYTHGSPDNLRKETKANVTIGRMPIMLRSCCCVLYGKDEAELAQVGECPLDPGGYFVIKGTEKVILIQEQLSKNRIIIDTDQKRNITASVTSSTEKIKTKTVIVMEKEKMWLQLNQFPKKVPLIIVMKAMGMESDQEVIQMVGRDPRYSSLLLPSFEECRKCGVYTQEQALEYLDSKVKQFMNSNMQPRKERRIISVLRDVFLANVPVHQDNFRGKCIYVAVMMRRIMDAILNKDKMDDKDYVGNKRLELSGQLISLLFEDLFKSMIDEAKKSVDTMLDKPDKASRFDICQVLAREKITLGLETTLSTGNFNVQRFRMERKGMTQVLQRLSFISALGQMTRVSPQFEKSRKVSGPRALQPSQWGMLCPCDTPEGEACGLVKNLALMTHVTTDEEEGPLISLCYVLGVEDVEYLSAEELHKPDSFLVIFNGLILGKHRRPQSFATAMRKLRRAGVVGQFVSVYANEKQSCVYLASDGGRVCRPLVIADKGISRVKYHHMKELKDGVRKFDNFLRDGLIEYLDVNEENNALIALYEGDATSETTHIEIEPFTILGVCAGLIPYPHHNQSPRNTYQCAMGKQAMGNIAYNQLNRMDTLLYLLVYPQRPLLTTKSIELVGYDKLGAGQNATVAVMSYSGYDIEDAIVMNKSSLDRGFGRCIVMKKLTVINQKYANGTEDRILRPDRGAPDAEHMQILDDDGLAAPGEILRPNDIYINKQSPKDTKITITGSAANLPDSAYNNIKQRFKGFGGEVVDRVVLCSDKNSNMCIKFMIRHTRRPELGDKFSSRHGQKGVCGTIVQQEDFPFSERGICPDLIMNPHGFPSRMTVGKMIELLGGKAGVSCGRFHYGSAFGEKSGHADKVETISETLVKHGFNYSGKDFIYSGITGCPLQEYIFMGPIYYQKLKHMVLDKMHARGSGPRTLLTRQPTEGRARNGGLRVGEMERDSLIAYGASMLIHERLMLSSDPFEVQWSMRLEGEEVKAVALGAAWVAAVTSLNYLRIFTEGGLQRHVFSLDGPVVVASGFKNELAVVTHASDCLSSNDQVLEFRLFNIPHGTQPLRGRLPLTPGSSLRWFGFSEEGRLCSYDSKGVLRLYTSQFGGSWLPVFSGIKEKSDENYWVVGLNTNKLVCVVCKKPEAFPQVVPKPILTLLNLSFPLASSDLGADALENEYMMNSMHLFEIQKSMEEMDNAGLDASSLDDDAFKLEAAQDKCILKLIASCCNGDKLERATELVKLLTLEKSMQAAIKLVTALKLPNLAERFSSILEGRLLQEVKKTTETNLKENCPEPIKADSLISGSKALPQTETSKTSTVTSLPKLSAPLFIKKEKAPEGAKDGINKCELLSIMVFCFMGFIHRVEADEVYLRFDQEFHFYHRDGNPYDVYFTYNRINMRRLYQAVEAAESLGAEFLFPSTSKSVELLSSPLMIHTQAHKESREKKET